MHSKLIWRLKTKHVIYKHEPGGGNIRLTYILLQIYKTTYAEEYYCLQLNQILKILKIGGIDVINYLRLR